MTHREAHRLFWIVKGHFSASEQTILDSAEGYFKRVWNNNEAYLHEDGFDEAYALLMENKHND